MNNTPEHYEKVAALLDEIGPVNLLRSLVAYAEQKYTDGSLAAYEAERKNEPIVGLGDWPLRQSTDRRLACRWLRLSNLSYAADNFENETRLATLTDEQIEAERKDGNIRYAEELLEKAKAGRDIPRSY